MRGRSSVLMGGIVVIMKPFSPLLVFLCAACFPGADGVAAGDPVKPALRILRDQCIGCHKPGKAKGGLLLTTYEKMMKGGDNGAVVVPGKGTGSALYKSALKDADPHMPPKKQLADAEITALRAWIDDGAKWDASVFDEPPAPKTVRLTTMPSAYAPVLALALAPDEKRLAFARGSAVIVVDLTKKERPVLARLEGHSEPVQSLAWSVDGRSIVSGGWQRILVWDAMALKLCHALAGSAGVPASAGPQSPDAQEHKEGMPTASVPPKGGTPTGGTATSSSLIGSVTALAMDPAGKFLFAADGEPGGAGFIRKFDLAERKLVATWKAHEDTVYALRLSAKGDRLVSAGADKLAKLWDAAAAKLIASYEGHTNHILSVAFNKDASQIATASADKEVKVWEVSTGNQEVKLGDKKTVYTGVSWTPDGKALVAVTDKGTGSIYTELQKHSGTERSETGKERRLGSVDDALTSVVITADAKSVFAGGFDGKVHFWDAASGKAAGEIAGGR